MAEDPKMTADDPQTNPDRSKRSRDKDRKRSRPSQDPTIIFNDWAAI